MCIQQSSPNGRNIILQLSTIEISSTYLRTRPGHLQSFFSAQANIQKLALRLIFNKAIFEFIVANSFDLIFTNLSYETVYNDKM